MNNENLFGITLIQFVPGIQTNINGATFSVNPQGIIIIPDQDLKDIKFGVEVRGGQALILGGWVPIGVIDMLPEREN